MALTQEFIQAVSQKNTLRVKIMLKDSLLVDTSFNQFNEMLIYADPRLEDLWARDDDENLSDNLQDLNKILAGLVNSFSHRRVNHLKEMIQKIYPPKQVKKSVITDPVAPIPKTKFIREEYNAIISDRKKMRVKMTRIVDKDLKFNTKDITEIKNIAKSIVNHCDNILER